MISRVLVPMDDSEMSEKALRYALEAYPDAEVTVLHVVGEPSPMMGQAVRLALEDDIQKTAEELAEALLDRAREIAAEYSCSWETSPRKCSAGRPSPSRRFGEPRVGQRFDG